MDLIELKSAWNLYEREVINYDSVNEESILTSVHAKSKSEISKIKRGLHVKFIVATFAIIFAASLSLISLFKPAFNPLDFIFTSVESAMFLGLMALTLAAMVSFNLRAYLQIKFIESSALNLSESLHQFIEAMRNAIKFNVYSDTLMTPIIFTWVYYGYAFKEHELSYDVRSVLLFVLPLLLGFLSYFLQKKMQELKFGNYLSKLEEFMNSLKNNSEQL